MRKLKVMEHISLDGVIEAGPEYVYGDWSGPYRTPEGLVMLMARYGEQFDLLLGRRTYDNFSGFWPTLQGEGPQAEMARRLNAATKYVVTHRPESLAWGPFEATGSDVAASVRAIKAKAGPDIVLTGSSTLTSAVLEHGLADEMVLMVNPVLLGTGKRLFADGTPPHAFTLESSKAMPSGIVVQSYKPAGGLKNLG